ncbi:MAG: AtuA-related protein [Alphaproteobacteria bacterium]|jgi:hypothetical protein
MRVGSISVGRSGDKGAKLDLTLVALDDEKYQWLEARLTTEVAQAAISRVMPGTVTRYPVPGLRALKIVVNDALPGGVYATLHAGLHWQKAAIWVLLDLELE